MKHGEVCTVADGPDYTGKPRPVVILQENRRGAAQSGHDGRNQVERTLVNALPLVLERDS